jgi:activator of the mannose operon (transcriptional antiterminator)
VSEERQIQLIQCLLETDSFISAQELAEKLNVSEKTIYRDIKEIEHINEEDTTLIEKIPGKGYKLNYSHFLKEKEKFSFLKNVGITDIDRKNQILLELLYKAPQATSIMKLTEKFFVSASSIVNDLKSIEKEVKKFHLQLAKTSSGTYITGDEKNIRRMLVSITHQYLPFENKWVLPQEENKVESENLDLFLKHFTEEDIQFIQQVIQGIESKLHFSLENPYYINLFSHLLILTKRVEEGAIVEDGITIKKASVDLQLLKIALEAIQEIEQYIEQKLSYSEVEYVYLYLISAGGQTEVSKKGNIEDDETSLSFQLVIDLLERISKKRGVKLHKNNHLKQQLVQHFKPLLKRMMYEIQIKNPLSNEIKLEFKDVFQDLREVMEVLVEKYSLPSITDDEIGYIVLYIQNAIELEAQHKNVLIVCSTGVGTSHLLKTRVARSFPDWNIVDVISAKEVPN